MCHLGNQNSAIKYYQGHYDSCHLSQQDSESKSCATGFCAELDVLEDQTVVFLWWTRTRIPGLLTLSTPAEPVRVKFLTSVSSLNHSRHPLPPSWYPSLQKLCRSCSSCTTSHIP
ncbi:hypothetical protein ACE6H2_000124 [Prunus campanulata]